MDIYSEGGLIFLVMVDHLNGELLGGVIDSFYAAGEDPETIGKAVLKDRMEDTVNPESAAFSIYTVSKKASELRNGPVTKLLVNASLPYVVKMIRDKALETYNGLNDGKALKEIVKALDDERVATVETYASKWWKKAFDRNVTIKFHEIANAARRTTKLVQKYFAFDPLVTVEVIEDGKRAYMEHFTDRVIPDVCFGKRDDVAWAVPVAAPAVSDLALSGCCILNIVVPASVAALMEYSSIADASEEAQRAAYITGGIPGGKASAMKVAEEALAVYGIIK